eukprot:TRINITY_DN9425_c0_g1_i1.p1 TRINITY_DN9425_c0_g1~~TRINITY_DN9425_c0_g1_i1.p1  ORF type:complete len:827 (-),score=254.49 TRINITY_DN9425_c0_g1_i1:97-2577(-)
MCIRDRLRRDHELVYFCISKFCFFTCTPENVKAAFEGLHDDDPIKQLDLVPDQVNYAHVTKIIRDTHDSMMFMVVMAEEDPILLESANREEVIEEVHIHWKTDYMMRLWRAPSLPILDEWIYGVPRTGGGDIALFTMAPKNKSKLDVDGYFLFVNDKFKPLLDQKKKEIPGAFSTSAEKLYVSKDKLRSCSKLGMRDTGNLKVETFNVAREFITVGGKAPPCVLMFSSLHRKRMNLSGDLASWNCWLVHLRTSQNDIMVAGCRRKYIPPSGEKYTTVWIKYRGPVVEENPMQEMEAMVDSLGPSVAVSYYDTLAIQIRTNLMQLDEEAFAFMFNRLVIEPELEDMHIRFYKGAVGLMELEGFPGASQDAIFEDVDPVEDIFEDVIDVLKEDPHEGVTLEEWAPRLARYCCFCLDGGILPEEIGLDEMCRMLSGKAKDENGDLIDPVRSRPTVLRVLDFLVHVKPRGKSFPKNGPPEGDPNFTEPGHPDGDLIRRLTILPDFEFQPRAMIRLLDNGWLHEAMGSSEYIQFLYKLLRMRGGQDVRIAICSAIAVLAENKNDRAQLAQANVIELLLTLSRSKDVYVSSACGRALIQLMYDSVENKDRVTAGTQGGKNIKLLISKLDSPSEELQMVYAMVIRNICSDQTYCNLFGRSGVNRVLCRLLEPPPQVMVPHPIDQLDKTRAALAACCWKLANSVENRDQLIDGKAHRSLIDILATTENESVIEKACGALMALASAAEDSEVKQDLRNQDAIEVLRRCLELCRNKESLRALIGAVVILTDDKDNLEQLLTLKDEYVDLLEQRADLAKTDKRLEFLVDALETKLSS